MRSWKVLAVLAVTLFANKGVLAEEVIVSISHGTIELPFLLVAPPGSGQVGELVTCEDVPMGEPTQVLVRVSYQYVDVCDDLGPTPCDDRLVFISEFCGNTADESQSGLIGANYNNTSKHRTCWDPSGAGQCTAEFEVATGESVGSQNQRLIGGPTAQTIGVVRVVSSSPFRVDGRNVKISKGTARIENTFETADADPTTNCILPIAARMRPDGCGIVSIATRTK